MTQLKLQNSDCNNHIAHHENQKNAHSPIKHLRVDCWAYLCQTHQFSETKKSLYLSVYCCAQLFEKNVEYFRQALPRNPIHNIFICFPITYAIEPIEAWIILKPSKKRKKRFVKIILNRKSAWIVPKEEKRASNKHKWICCLAYWYEIAHLNFFSIWKLAL